MLAWHFLRDDLTCGHGRLGKMKVGKTLKVRSELELCCNGLHASKRIIDALGYAPGPVICRVEMGGEIIESDDKLIASKRTVIWMEDISDLLFRFACDEAERALNERKAEGYQIDKRSYAAIEAKRGHLKGTVTDDELSAARSAARSTARSAARSAAWSAAESAAWSAARSAARSAQNKRLTDRVMRLMKKQEAA